ncbi:AtpZ/AtpI family protein [Paracoccus sp. Z118]|uniref:AtpZ/AtpI family protein n=1 Tax=Paracoccus sp. Z118 TaxID=2851017 RepID=UPI001C2C182A|nr:AtpZ/AtpI family protein [Paracoccus sp. Z118]MBV0890650.1 AtpZ/AtpI family protein [Paracoccus sp. Z118]
MPGVGKDSQHDTDRAADAERLRALEAGLARARGEKLPIVSGGDKYHQANNAWRMVIELVAGLGIGFGIGYGLDRLFGTLPILLVVFTLLGFAAGVKTMLRTAAELSGPPAKKTPDSPAENTPDHPAGDTPAGPARTKGTQRGD